MLFTKLARLCPSLQSTSKAISSKSLKESKNVNIFDLTLIKRFISSVSFKHS